MTVRVACIGVGGYGWVDLMSISRYATVTALCDVDEKPLQRAKQIFPAAIAYRDYRRLFDQGHHLFDAVSISTPDHTHASLCQLAIQFGKHCYCQKPLVRTLQEASLLKSLLAKSNLSTQLGLQGLSSWTARQAICLLKDQAIGSIQEIHLWTDRPGQYWKPVYRLVNKPADIPEGLDWHRWLDGHSARPYRSDYHPFRWRSWFDFGTGALGDMGFHLGAIPFLGIDLGTITEVSGSYGKPSTYTYPAWSELVYTFSSGIRLYWYDGGKRPPEAWLEGEVRLDDNGCLIRGSEGSLYLPTALVGRYLHLLPKAKFRDVNLPIPPTPLFADHYQEWIASIQQPSTQPLANFWELGLKLAELVLLGNLLIQQQKTQLRWDSTSFQVITMQ